MVFLRIHKKVAFVEWLWGLGWQVGTLKGIVKYVVFAARLSSKPPVPALVSPAITANSD
jgi:hypothetical protein